jgi:FMN-dependent NADH-azoreductase
MRTIRTISFSNKAARILDLTNPKNVSNYVSKCVEMSGGMTNKVLFSELEDLKEDMRLIMKQLGIKDIEIVAIEGD